MVQTKMAMTPITYENRIIDVVPTTMIIKKKVITDNNEFEDRCFVRIPVTGTDRYHKNEKSNLEMWCYEHYGEPKQLGRWFKISGWIILDERTYTHWKLCS